MLNFIGLIFFGALVWPSDSVIVKSRTFTNYGEWYDMEYCPDGMYAMGVNAKYDKDTVDITYLNGVAFYCEPLNSLSYTHKHRITSGVGPFGEWGHFDSMQYCPQDKAIVGFYLYTGTHTIADDTGAIHFIALCGYPFSSRDPSDWKLEDKVISDLPIYKYFCPEGYAINGIQTQVESAQGMGDDTGLNNINVNCQEIILSCTHEFISLFDYSNSGGLMNERRTI
ncbi:hypothetical protein FO519_009508 [Halicephalobus sp. NKZ332]|nr:hypothetical protein FO519_009508 [Halicephalobus sp. NKZ332]